MRIKQVNKLTLNCFTLILLKLIFTFWNQGIIFWFGKQNTCDTTIFNIIEGNIAGLAEVLLQIRTFNGC